MKHNTIILITLLLLLIGVGGFIGNLTSKKENFVNLSPVKFNNLLCSTNENVNTSKDYNNLLIKNDRLTIQNIMKSLNPRFIKESPPTPIPIIKQSQEIDYKCYPDEQKKTKKQKEKEKKEKILLKIPKTNKCNKSKSKTKQCQDYCKQYFNAYVLESNKDFFNHYKKACKQYICDKENDNCVLINGKQGKCKSIKNTPWIKRLNPFESLNNSKFLCVDDNSCNGLSIGSKCKVPNSNKIGKCSKNTMIDKINKFKKHENLTKFFSFNKNINKAVSHFDDTKIDDTKK